MLQERQERDAQAAAVLQPPTSSKQSKHAANRERSMQRVQLQREIDDLRRQLQLAIPQAIDAKKKEVGALTIRMHKLKVAKPTIVLLEAARHVDTATRLGWPTAVRARHSQRVPTGRPRGSALCDRVARRKSCTSPKLAELNEFTRLIAASTTRRFCLIARTLGHGHRWWWWWGRGGG